jgi:hypothetical protein
VQQRYAIALIRNPTLLVPLSLAQVLAVPVAQLLEEEA